MSTPYAEHVGGHSPLATMRDSAARYRALVDRLTPEQWQAPWAPGKWTRHQVVVHVMQWEIIFSTRVRMAVAAPDYVVQPMEQDDLLNLEAPLVDVPTVTAAFLGLHDMNVSLVAGLTPEMCARVVTHPERGQIDVQDLLITLAGHPVHHLNQIED